MDILSVGVVRGFVVWHFLEFLAESQNIFDSEMSLAIFSTGF